MRLLFLTLLFLAGSLKAADPSLAPTAQPAAALPGVYQAYTPPPTAVPTPAAAPAAAERAMRISLHKDTMSLDLRGGGAVPLGDMAKVSNAGWSAGGELVYGASELVQVAFFVDYASIPYKLTTAAKPQTSLGIGLKALVDFFPKSKFLLGISGGLGYFNENYATSPVRLDALGQPVVDPATNEALHDTVYKAGGGMGFELGAMLGMKFTPHFATVVRLDAVQVSLSGGTGDTPQFLMPTLNLLYTF
jgi:hypothetical protein